MKKPSTINILTAVTIILILLTGGLAAHIGSNKPVITSVVAQPIPPPPTQPMITPTPKSYGHVSLADLRYLKDLVKQREMHVRALDAVLDELQKKNKDAIALTHIADSIEKWVTTTAKQGELDAKCFVLNITDTARKKCASLNHKVWGIEEDGDLQVEK